MSSATLIGLNPSSIVYSQQQTYIVVFGLTCFFLWWCSEHEQDCLNLYYIISILIINIYNNGATPQPTSRPPALRLALVSLFLV